MGRELGLSPQLSALPRSYLGILGDHTVLQTGSHVAQATLGLALQSKLIFLQLPPGYWDDRCAPRRPDLVSQSLGRPIY